MATYPQRTTSPTSLDLMNAPQAGAGPSAYTGGPGSSVSWASGGANYSVTPNTTQSDRDTMTHQNNLAIQQQREKAALAAQADARRMASINALVGGGGGSAGPAPAGGNIAYDEAGARSAAFGRAKEQAGQTALASLTALENVMSSRGLKGSSIEGNATADIIGGGADDVNDYTREQLMQDLNRAASISDRNYSGGIAMRGQDLSKMQSLLGLFSGGGAY